MVNSAYILNVTNQGTATAIDMALAASGWDIDQRVAAAVNDARRANVPFLPSRVR